MDTGESVGDAAVTVFHVDDNEVVAGEGGDFGESGGEGEEEEAVEGFIRTETGFEVAVGWGGGCGGDCDGGVVGEGFEKCRILSRGHCHVSGGREGNEFEVEIGRGKGVGFTEGREGWF